MKKILYLLPFLCCLLCGTLKTQAQTTLSAGDVAIVGYNSDAAIDEFSFILLTNISSGTQISFTDFGWCKGVNGTGFQSPSYAITDGALTWQSSTAMACGSQVKIVCGTVAGLSASAGTIVSHQTTSSNTSLVMSLPTGGDQIFAYQGTLAAPTLIACLQSDVDEFGNTWRDTLSTTTFTPSRSTLPAALTSGTNAIGFNPEMRDLSYNCTVTSSSPANLRTAIFNTANWNKQNGTAYTLPLACTFSCSACTAPSVTGQPGNSAICGGANTSFGVTATGTGLTYQWQENTGSGFTNRANGGVYSGATTATLTITGATAGMSTYQYRCVVTGTCGNATSNAATLTVNSAPSISVNPGNSTICAGANTTFGITASGAGVTHQWQVNTGSGYGNVTNGGVYSNATTATLGITGATAGMNGYQYRCVATGTCTPAATSSGATLTVNVAPSISAQPSTSTICAGANTSFSVTASNATGYQWQVDVGSGYGNVTNGGVYTNATTATLNITGATAGMNGYAYRCVVTGACTPAATSNGAALIINSAPAIATQASNTGACAGGNASFTIVANNATGYQWQENQGAGYVNVTNGGIYSNATTATLNITGATAGMDGYLYRCSVSGACAPNATSTGRSLTITTAPSISAQPSTSTICAGGNASFSVTASNATGYQWQVDVGSGYGNVTNGGVYSNATTATLNITGPTGMNGYAYRCVVTGACTPAATSNGAALIINSAPAITAQPSAANICAGANTTFSVTASNATGYQWQVDQGSGYANVTNTGVYTNATTATLNITGATAGMNGYAYRCVVTSGCTPAATSNGVALTINVAPAITAQPSAGNICAGANTTFSVTASNATGYQWQVDQGAGYANISNTGVYTNATTATLTITGATAGMSGYAYRCIATGACTPDATSNSASLTVNPAPAITAQPSTSTICAGANASFSVTASNATGYQWQVDQGSGFANVTNTGVYTNATTATLTITGATAGMNGYAYRCIVTGGCTPAATSNGVALTINSAPSISAQPSNTSACVGGNASFTVSASNATGYQWQVDQGAGYANISNTGVYTGATTATLNITGATAGMNGYLYRCVVTGACAPAATSTGRSLTITTAPSISAQPTHLNIICAGSNSSFSITASNATGYQWQVDQGSGFTNVSNTGVYTGATTATLTITAATAGMSGYEYRCVVTGACAPNATSNTGQLNVGPLPSISANPSTSTICAGANTSFSATASNATSYIWQVDQGGGYNNVSNSGVYTNATTATLTITGATAGMNGYVYRCIALNSCGNAISSGASLTINVAPGITAQPSNKTICATNNTTFSVTATNATGYQWQENTGSGYANISNTGVYSGTTTATLAITGATAGMTGYLYRCVASGACSPNVTSSGASLTITTAPAITGDPANSIRCAGTNTNFGVAASNATGYQWQENQGAGFSNITNGGIYSNATTATLTVTGVTTGMNGYQYRCVVTGACTPAATSSSASLTVNPTPAITAQPSTSTICAGANTTFSVTASNATGYQWQVDQGAGYANISNTGVYTDATTATLTITGATAGMNGYAYRCVVTGGCTPAATSNGAILTISSAPAVTADPVNRSICSGNNTTFVVTATGVGLTYQWQVDNGGGFTNLSNTGVYTNATTATLTITGVTESMEGYLYRCVVTGTCGSPSTSNSASLTVPDPAAVTADPVNRSICSGNNTTYGVTATGAGLTYQWQVDNGGGFTNLSNTGVYTNATTATLTITGVTESMEGYLYRCVVTGTCGSPSTSNSASLTVPDPAVVTVDPVNRSICSGNNTTFGVTATGVGLNYQWQVNTGSGFGNISNTGVYTNATTATLTITGVTESMEGYLYRCVVSATCGSAATSNSASLTVPDPAVVTVNPVNRSICSGNNTTFVVTATGVGLTYQWQVDNGGGFTNLSNTGVYTNATTATLTITGVTESMEGYLYRCVVSATCGSAATSNSASLTVPDPAIVTADPSNANLCSGGNTSFSVTATGVGLTYQWQVNTGSGFTNLSNTGVYTNATTATLTITGVAESMEGYLYRCVVSATCGSAATSNSASLTVPAAAAVTADPVNRSICSGNNTTFGVTATGVGLTYQWQVNTGSGFTNLSNTGVYTNATTATLTITGVAESMEGYLYRCVVSATCGSAATSNSASLTVPDPAAVTADPVNRSICSGTNTTFGVTATGVGLTYQWQVNTGSGFGNISNTGVYTNATTATLTITGVTESMEGYLYRCVVSATCGSAATSNSASLTVPDPAVVTVDPVNRSICSGNNTTFGVTATGVGLTYQWQVNTGSGFGNISNTGVYTNATTATLTITGVTESMEGYLYRCVVSATCGSAATSNSASLTVPDPAVVTVNPVNRSICSGNNTTFVVTATGVGLTYQWQVDNGGGFTNLSNTGVYTNATTATLTITGVTESMEGYLYRCVVSATCGSAATSNSASLTVPDPAVVTADPVNRSICSGTNTTFGVTATGVGLSYQWQVNTGSGFGNISNTGVYTNATTATLNITGMTAGMNGYLYRCVVSATCGSAATSNSASLTVTQSAAVTVQPSNQSVCDGGNTSISITAIGAGATYQWQVDNGSGFANVSNSTLYSNVTTNTLNITGATLSMNSYLYRCVVTGTCNIATSNNATLSVNPIPDVNSVSNQAVCAGMATTVVNFSGSIGSTTFNWTNNTTSIGLGASGSGNIASFTAVNAGMTDVTATITVTPSTVTCTGPAKTFDIKVKAIPTVNAIADQAVCNGNNTSAVTFGSSLAGATFSWTNNNTSIGLAASGNGNLPSFAAVNATNAPVVATITVTPTANGCIGTPLAFTITVNPGTSVNTLTAQQLCNGASTAAINFTGPVAGTVFNWTNNTTSIGLAANGTGNIGSFAAINAGNAPVVATIGVTPVANGCTGPTKFMTITVNPIPMVNAVANQTLCNGASTTAVNFGGSAVAGTVYNWTNNNSSIGLGGVSTGNIASFTAQNTQVGNVVATITVTPVANGCTGASQVFTITVKPTPTVDAVSNQSVCSGVNTAAVNFSGNIGATVYNWVNDNAAILAVSGTGNIGSFATNNIGSTNMVANITVTPEHNGCAGSAKSFSITVKPIPSVTAVGNQTLCNGTATTAVNFTGSAVTGTAYNWTNNNASIGLAASGTGNIGSFAAVNTGTTDVVATITATPVAAGCTGSAQVFTITVKPTPTVAAVTNQLMCNGANTAAVNFSGSAVGGTVYNWTNDNTSIGLAASGSGNIASFASINSGSANAVSTITVTPVANGCNGPSKVFTITVKPTPMVNAVTNQAVCNGANTIAVTFSGPVSGTVYNWTNDNTSTGLGANGSGNIGSFTATNATNNPVVSTVTVTTVANGCIGTNQVFTITVNPTPTVAAVSNQSVCKGANTVVVTFGGSAVSGTIYNWTNSNTGIGLTASGSGNIGSFTGTNSFNSPLVSTVTVTPVANGCSGPSKVFTITVNPTPVVSGVSNQGVCNGASTSAVNFSGSAVVGTVYNWTNDNTSIGLGASGSGNIGSFSAVNTGSVDVVSTVTVTPVANGCGGSAQVFTITVKPTPTVAAVGNQAVCKGSNTAGVTFSGAVSGTVYNWTNDNTGTGLAASGSGNIASFAGTNSGNAPLVSTVTVTPVANGCSGAAQVFTITVNPTPVVNAVSNQLLCNGSSTAAVNFGGAVAGTVYNWTNNNTGTGLAASGSGNIGSFTATNAGSVNLVSTVTVTPSANGCTGSVQVFTITVKPTPVVNAVSNQALCNGSNTTAVTFTGSAVAGTVYNWTNNNTSTGLSASGSGNIGSFTATNATNSPVVSTVTVTPVANGCSGTPQVFTITVSPVPGVNTLSAQQLCNGASTAAINFSGPVGGTVFNWVNNRPSIGLGASGSGNIASFVAVNVSNAPVVATIGVTPVANGCTGPAKFMTITVNPTPVVNAVTNQSLCNGVNTAAVTFSGSAVSGTVYQWTNNNSNIGLAGTGSGNIASFVAINNQAGNVVSTITVTPVANGCNGASQVFTITVKPTPGVNAVSNQVVCNGVNTAAVNFGGPVGGTVYNWTNDNTSTGLSASGSGNIASFVGTNAGPGNAVSTITVTPVANGCNGTPKVFTITVKPTPSVVAVANQTLCGGTSTAAVTFSGGVPGTVYSWTNNNTSIGLAAGGTGNIASFTAVNAGGTNVVSTITVTPAANGCNGTPQVFTITVKPVPAVNMVSNQALCNGANTTAVTLTGSAVGGTVYNWTNSAPSIGLAAGGSGNIGSFTATNSGNAPVVATITVTPEANGCNGTVKVFTITVNPIPSVNTLSAQQLCNGASTAAINFSGPVSGTVFNWLNNTPSIGLAANGSGNIASFTGMNAGNAPVVATIGVTPVANGCTGPMKFMTITVNPIPSVDPVASQTLCNGVSTAAINFSGSAVAGTVYNWTNTNSNIGLGGVSTGNIPSFVAQNNVPGNIVATVTVTPTANGCSGSSQVFTITVKPTPSVVAISNQSVCNGANTSAVNFSGPVTGTVYNWTNDNTGTGLAASGSGNIASFAGTNAGNTSIVSNITVSPTANGCAGAGQVFSITVKPTPSVNAVGNQSLCNGAATTAVTFGGSAVAGTVYNWTNTAASIGLAGSGSGNIASFVATNTGSANVVATITATPVANSCSGTPQVFTITVKPTAVVDVVADQIVCNGTGTTAVTFSGAVAGTVYNWTNNNTSIGLAASGSGNIASFVATNAGATSVVSTITVTPVANGCGGTAKVFTITVRPTPSVNAVTNQSICNGANTAAVALTGSAVAGTVYNWTNDNTSTGLAASGIGAIASFTGVNTGAVNQVSTITVTPTANGCSGTPKMFTITVKPTPDVAVVADQTLCNGASTTAVSFSGAVAGTVYNWTNSTPSIGLAASGSGNIASFNAINAGAVNVVSTITVTPVATGCGGTPQVFTITVKPTPTVAAVTNQSICNGANTTAITFSGAVTGTVYNWTNNNTSTGLAASGSGNIASFAGVNAGAVNAVSTVTVTPVANGCSGTPQVFTITVKPTPTVTAVSNQTLCNGVNTAAVTFSGAVAGTVYNWTNSTPSIGLAASGSGNIASFMATNATASPVTATITVTPTATGCGGTPQVFTITVKPTPVVNAVAGQTVCNNTPTTAVAFSSATSGTTYSWTNNTTSIGLAASGSGNIASFTAQNAGTTNVVATITVTPTAALCAGAPANFTITVKPSPVLNALTTQTVCNGIATAPVNFSGSPVGTTFNWTNDNTSIGLAAGGSGNIASFTATNSGNAPVVATLTVTPVLNGCNGPAKTMTITVNPTPQVTAVGNQLLCNGDMTTAVTLGGSAVTGTVYNWTNNNTTIGLAASGSGNIASFAATNAGAVNVVSTITVTPAANGCNGPSKVFMITVKPTPSVNAVTNQTLCNGANTTAVNFTGSAVTGTVYTWTNNVTTIGLAGSGSGNIASFVGTNITAAPVTATITVTPTATGCSGTPQVFTIRVNPTPVVSPAIANQLVCNGSSTAAITLASSTGGATFAWTNNTTSIGLAASGTGANIASFTGTNSTNAPVTATITAVATANGCPGTPHVFTITVNPTPQVDAIANKELCNGAATGAINFSGPVSGTVFKWTNSLPSIGLASPGTGNIASFNAVNAGTAPVTATITVTPEANGCFGTPKVFTIKVNPTATVNAVSNQALCNGATTAAVTLAGPVSGTVFNWTNSAPSIGLAASGTGTSIAAFNAVNTGTAPVVATITVTPEANGCTGTVRTFTITVNPIPQVDAITNKELCNGVATGAINFSGPVSGTVYNWGNTLTSIGLAASGSGNIASFNAVNAGTAPVTATITVTPVASGCTGTAKQFTIKVNPTPVVNAIANQQICAYGTLAVNFSGAVSGTTYSWTNDNANIGLNPSGTGNISFLATNTLSVPITGLITVTPQANGCSGVAKTFTILVKPATFPVINIASDAVDNKICKTKKVTFTATISNGGTTPVYQWKLNGVNIGTNNPVYTIDTLDDNDTVKCMLTSNIECPGPTATVPSNEIIMDVEYWANHTITITSDALHDTLCAGIPANFSSVIANGGNTPVYQWKKNGLNVGGNSPSYTDLGLANGDVIRCELTSSVMCPAAAGPVLSNPLKMAVMPQVSVSVTIIGIYVGDGTAMFHGVATGTGVSPKATYQWTKNDVPIPYATRDSVLLDGLKATDVIKLVVDPNVWCSGAEFAESNAIAFSKVTSVGNTASLVDGFKLYPNPNSGKFTIEGKVSGIQAAEADLIVTNMLGQVVHRSKVDVKGGAIKANLELNIGISSGSYMLTIQADNKTYRSNFRIIQ